MCLVIGKPKGILLPKNKELKKAFNQNCDGFGISFQYEGKIRTLKGAMTVKDMFTLIDRVRMLIKPNRLEDIDAVLQWRKAVTGSISQRFCHPFPITHSQEELDSLDVISTYSLAHNGIIYDYNWAFRGRLATAPADINDAQEFIKDFLFGMGAAILIPAVQQLIEVYTDSKFAILSPHGISYIGDFQLEKGCFYSNLWHRFQNNFNKPGWSDNYYSQGTNFVETSDKVGHFLCNFCESYVDRLYFLPDDEDSQICSECFIIIEGRRPFSTELCF